MLYPGKPITPPNFSRYQNDPGENFRCNTSSVCYDAAQLRSPWCLISARCHVISRDAILRVTWHALRSLLAGPFMSVVERGVRVEWVPNSFANFNLPFLCLALMVPCCLCLFCGAALWWPFTRSVIFTYSVFSFVWCDVIKSTVFYSLFYLVSEGAVLHF